MSFKTFKKKKTEIYRPKASKRYIISILDSGEINATYYIATKLTPETSAINEIFLRNLRRQDIEIIPYSKMLHSLLTAGSSCCNRGTKVLNLETRSRGTMVTLCSVKNDR